MSDKFVAEPVDQPNCHDNFFYVKEDFFNLLNKNNLDSLYNDSDNEFFPQNKRQCSPKSFLNPFYPNEKNIMMESRPMTPNKLDYSPNKLIYPKTFFPNPNEDFIHEQNEPKKTPGYNQQFINPIDSEFIQKQRTNFKCVVKFEEKEDVSLDNNFLAAQWGNMPNDRLIRDSPKKFGSSFEEHRLKPISSFDEPEEGILRTPQKSTYGGLYKGKPFIKKEPKIPVSFRNYYPDDDFEPVSTNAYSYPRQGKRENPFWQEAQFHSEKKAMFQEKINNNRETPHRSDRGLRILSLRVKDIVLEKSHTTYKQVAESLIDQMETFQDFKENSQKEDQNKQNIKRRVYDALNVLIAADVLKKNGKTVHTDESTGLIGKYCKTSMAQEKLKYHRKIMEMENIVQMKKGHLQESLLKLISLRHLVNRNKEILQDPTANISEEELIKIPFVVLVLPEGGLNSVEIIQNFRNKSQLKIFSKEALNLYGDVDILMKLNFFRVEKKKLDEFLPKETHKYLPDEIKDQK